MKRLLSIFCLLITLSSNAQFSSNINSVDTSYSLIGFPSNAEIARIKDTFYYKFQSNQVWLKSLRYDRNTATTLSRLVYADDSGILKITPIANLPISSSQVTTALGFTPYSSSNPSSYITTAGARTAISLTTTGSGAATYNSSTGALNIPTPVTTSFSPIPDTLSSARTFGTVYQNTTGKYVEIKPCAQISCNLSLSGGQAGAITLQVSSDNITWKPVGQITGSNTGTLTIGLNTTQITGGQLSVMVPPNYYWQVTTSSTVGSPTFTMLQGGKSTYQ